MAELMIQLARHPETGANLLRVSLGSEEDATPREHEQDHRRLVASLFPTLDLDGCAPSNIVVERERPASEPALPCCGGDDGYEVIDLG